MQETPISNLLSTKLSTESKEKKKKREREAQPNFTQEWGKTGWGRSLNPRGQAAGAAQVSWAGYKVQFSSCEMMVIILCLSFHCFRLFSNPASSTLPAHPLLPDPNILHRSGSKVCWYRRRNHFLLCVLIGALHPAYVALLYLHHDQLSRDTVSHHNPNALRPDQNFIYLLPPESHRGSEV